MFKAILKKQTPTFETDFVLEMEVPSECSGIKEFIDKLKIAGIDKDDPIQNGVCRYLLNADIIDRNNELTSRGREAYKSGTLMRREVGKYSVLFVDDQTFLGRVIVKFKRIEPVPYNPYNETPPQRPDNLSIDTKKKSFNISNDSKDVQVVKVRKSYLSSKPSPYNSPLTVEWRWTGLVDSELILNEKNPTIYEEDLKAWIQRIAKNSGIKWSRELERMEINESFISNLNPMELDSCLARIDCGSVCGFDSVVFEDLEVMPGSQSDAEIWLNRILDQWISSEYVNPVEFEQRNKNFTNRSYIKKFAIHAYTASEYLNKLKYPGRNRKDSRYWHIAAPIDLNPDMPRKTDRFAFAPNRETTFAYIAERLAGRIKPDYVWYIDKYISNEQQQRKFIAFMHAFCIDDKSVSLITLPNKRNFAMDAWLKSNHPDLNISDLDKIIVSGRIPHSRYIVFRNIHDDGKSKHDVWMVTDSIDFMFFEDLTDIGPHTKGKTRDVTFVRCEIELLGQELMSFISGSVK